MEPDFLLENTDGTKKRHTQFKKGKKKTVFKIVVLNICQ